ncbi:MAG: glycine cleavage system protein GcvH [Patescibacteria group bacterium]|jgi:glycine cleavage system H protein
MSEHKIQNDLYYNKDHEWVKIVGNEATVGISDYAQQLLTDVVFVELPDIGKIVKQFERACVVESVKSVSDVYAPVGGIVAAVNKALETTPEAVNTDPYGAGWIYKLSGVNAAETSNLMDAPAYKTFLDQDKAK